MSKKITAFLVFLASSQAVVMAEDVWNPSKPIVHSWFHQLSAVVERIFTWL